MMNRKQNIVFVDEIGKVRTLRINSCTQQDVLIQPRSTVISAVHQMGAEGHDRGRYATREALKNKQGASVKKTSIEIPVMLLKHSLFTKTKNQHYMHSSPLSLQEVWYWLYANCKL